MVETDVITTLEKFKGETCSLERLNKLLLFLFPKCYQPISLSNSIYLVIAKVLGNSLREVIRELVCFFESAFICGRQLVDSTVLVTEILVLWKRVWTKGFMWKLDFAKAYNCLD